MDNNNHNNNNESIIYYADYYAGEIGLAIISILYSHTKNLIRFAGVMVVGVIYGEEPCTTVGGITVKLGLLCTLSVRRCCTVN